MLAEDNKIHKNSANLYNRIGFLLFKLLVVTPLAFRSSVFEGAVRG